MLEERLDRAGGELPSRPGRIVRVPTIVDLAEQHVEHDLVRPDDVHAVRIGFLDETREGAGEICFVRGRETAFDDLDIAELLRDSRKLFGRGGDLRDAQALLHLIFLLLRVLRRALVFRSFASVDHVSVFDLLIVAEICRGFVSTPLSCHQQVRDTDENHEHDCQCVYTDEACPAPRVFHWNSFPGKVIRLTLDVLTDEPRNEDGEKETHDDIDPEVHLRFLVLRVNAERVSIR